MVESLVNRNLVILKINIIQSQCQKFAGSHPGIIQYFEYGIILKESIRFRADKESSFIQKIKLL